jgi:hypothetical protein
VNSVGSKGDSYDNALAETIIGLYKAELVRNRGPWGGLDDLELVTFEGVVGSADRVAWRRSDARIFWPSLELCPGARY